MRTLCCILSLLCAVTFIRADDKKYCCALLRLAAFAFGESGEFW